MGFPAARVGDMHVCPMVTPGTPPVPHVGGPILPPGTPTVFIGGMPAAVVGNMCTCVGPPDSIVKGSLGVFICGMPAARMGDMTVHGGSIVMGCPTVLIGDMGGGGIITMNGITISIDELKKNGLNEKSEDESTGIIEAITNYIETALNKIAFAYASDVKYGNITIKPNVNDRNYQDKVLADLKLIEETPTGKALLQSLNDAGGATIKKTEPKKGNSCDFERVVSYNPDKETIGTEAWETRPPAIGLAHELIHANHMATDTLHIKDTGEMETYDNYGPNDSKPNPADKDNPPLELLEELYTVGIPPNDTDPYTENKIRSEWSTPQPQREWY
jgi:uncharacterized Zn-binding protein involved in type VI secretion